MSRFDDRWKAWIWQNVAAGCSKDVLFRILLDEGFDYDAIAQELGHEPEVPLDEIENPYPPSSEAGDQVPFEEASPALELHGEPLAPQLWQIDGVLTADECEALIEAARPRLERSTVVVDENVRGEAGGNVSEVRTGSAAYFLADDESSQALGSIAAKLRELVSALSEAPVSHQEPLQVLHYDVDQEYHAHHDAFPPGSEYLEWERERGGQRISSFMVYLNDVPAGGQTEFPYHRLSVAPVRGRAVFWKNLQGEALYEPSTHAALPVLEGEKWVLVCWIREAGASPSSDAEPRPSPIASWLDEDADLACPAWILEQTREQQARVPVLGAGGARSRGFEVRRLESALYDELRSRYAEIKSRLVPETDGAIGSYLESTQRDMPPALFYEDSALNDRVLARLKPLHEAWCGFELAPAACYGFRVYLPGAYLHEHVDRPETHVISSSLCVDASVYAPWMLTIEDVAGGVHEVDLKPGELLLYESAKLAHGRPVPLNGRFHVGLFVHYRPAVAWELWCESPQDWWREHGGG